MEVEVTTGFHLLIRMAIITQTTLFSSFSRARIFDLVDEGGGPNTADINVAIAEAEGDIKNMLSKLYTTAQIEADASVQYICKVLTMFKLELRRSDFTPQIQQAHDRAQERLGLLARGETKLAAVAEVLPRIEQTDNVKSNDIFGESGMFDGLPTEEKI